MKKIILFGVVMLVLCSFAYAQTSHYCYQESANVSTLCGGFSSGYYFNINFGEYNQSVIDGDWNTFYNKSNATGYFNMETHLGRPTNAIGAIWTFKNHSSGKAVNFTLPQTCWDYADVVANHNISLSVWNYPDNVTQLQCYNGSNVFVGNLTQTEFYEDAIWWNMTNRDIYNCTTKGYPTINFSLRNESTDTLLSGTMEFVFDYSWMNYTGNFSTEVIATNHSFCISPNTTWVLSDIMVDYTVGGESYNYFAYQVNLSDATRLVTLYATSGTTQVTFNVKDTGGDNIEYAYIHIEKYDAGTNTYKEVEVLRTGNDGNAYGEILLGDWYRFTIRYQGTAYLVDGPIRQIATTKNFRIDLLGADWFDDYDVIRNVAHSLTFNNATLKFSFTWNDPELEITSACLRVRQRNATRDTLINESCTTAHSGTINMAINTTGSVDDKTFVAVGYFRMIQSPITEFVADVLEKSFDYEWMIYDSEGKGFGLFMTALVTIALILIGATAAGPIGAIVGGVLGIFVMSTLNIFYLSTPIMITIVIVGGVVAYRINNAK